MPRAIIPLALLYCSSHITDAFNTISFLRNAHCGITQNNTVAWVSF